jgi:16S rRNA (uracil1498-N3)-methyltransferase
MDIQATNFFVESDNIESDKLYLDDTESHHLAKVMRARPGDIFSAIDGKGNKYQCRIIESNPRKVVAQIAETSRMENESLCRITLACGLCRLAKVDFIVEKGTELGVDEFYFFVSNKTLADEISEKSAASKITRWRKLTQSAAKQSLRTIIPEIYPIAKYEDILSLGKKHELSLIAEFGAESKIPLRAVSAKPSSALLLVGPESGLETQEIELAHQAGFIPFGLGPRRLRAETAAMAFTTIIMSQLGEL